MLRQRAKCTAQPSGASHAALPSSGRGRCPPHLLTLFSSTMLRLYHWYTAPDLSVDLSTLLFFSLLLLSSVKKRDRAAKPRSSQQSQQSQTQTQCRRSGCSNVSPGCTDLCPECHTRGQGREVGRRAQAPKEKSKQRCRTQGCDHYANQEKQGYCNECDHFKQIYRG